ncbi:MAG: tRNA (adenosine(37)-N6)-threonylcarbamoyltransferase complex transferase subunit TsaD [Eubacteriales bacterium]|jgi:N6-L-threonylcarbamoyladenine synthase
MRILAIESSCDETACAVVEDGRRILSNVVASQIEIHKLYGGVVPEIASRKHSECISQVAQQAIEEAGLILRDMDAIAVTFAPGLIGALLVGVNFAKGLAAATGKPLIPVHHIRGHIAANYLEYPQLTPPFLCLVASGGHSHIVWVKDYTSFEILGRTRDDAAGEAFDKAARVLGLSYPGGVQIDRLARQGNRDAIAFPRVQFKDAPYDFSFSGVKTAVINYVHNQEQKGLPVNRADVAASFNEAVAGVLCDKLARAARETGARTVCIAGGVGANSILREKAQQAAKEEGFTLCIPPLHLCGDNAAMIGAQAYYEFLAGHVANSALNGRAQLHIDFC